MAEEKKEEETAKLEEVPKVETPKTEASPKEKPSKPILTEEEVLRRIHLFGEFLKVSKGEPDIHSRIKIMSDPDPLETMTILSPDQIDVVEICADIADYFPEFEPLTDDCRMMMKASISLEGRGRNDVKEMESVENFLNIARMLPTPMNVLGGQQLKTSATQEPTTKK